MIADLEPGLRAPATKRQITQRWTGFVGPGRLEDGALGWGVGKLACGLAGRNLARLLVGVGDVSTGAMNITCEEGL